MAEKLTPEVIRARLRKAAGMKESENRIPAQEQAGSLDDFQRLIIQNIFDSESQVKRKAAYLEKHGFILNPNDHNQYRLKDSSDDWQEIDPGIGTYKDMFSEGEYKKMAKEFMLDLGDISVDTFISGKATAEGATAGSTLGPMGALFGGILGGAAGNAAAEGLKTAMGDTLLDGNVPVDKEKLIYESLVAGLVPKVLKGAGNTVKEAVNNFKTSRLISGLKAVENASKKLGVLDETVIEDAVANPTKYSISSLNGATRRLKSSYKDFYGIDEAASYSAKDVNKIAPDSVFGKILNPLREAQTQEIEKLSKNPNASFKIFTGGLQEPTQKLLANGMPAAQELGIVDILQKNINEISNIPLSSRSREQRSAMAYLQTKLKEVIGDAKKAGNIKSDNINEILNEVKQKNIALNFDASKKLLESVQDDIFNREVNGASVLKQIFGGGPDGFRQMLDNKAAMAGSKLPEINAKMSQGLELFNNTQKNLTPSNIASAFTGKENIRKLQVQDDLNNIGQYARDTSSFVDDLVKVDKLKIKNTVPLKDFTSDFKTEALQSSVENMFKAGKNIGSGNALIGGAQESMKQGAKRAGQAFGITVGPLGVAGASKVGGVAGAIGAIQGFGEGAMAGSPNLALRNITEKGSALLSRIEPEQYQQIASSPANYSTLRSLPSIASGALKEGLSSVTQKQPADLANFLRAQAAQQAQPYLSGQGDLSGLDNYLSNKDEVSQTQSEAITPEQRLERIRQMIRAKSSQASQ